MDPDTALGESVNREWIEKMVDSFLERDVIDRDNGSLLISDRFFRLWVQSL